MTVLNEAANRRADYKQYIEEKIRYDTLIMQGEKEENLVTPKKPEMFPLLDIIYGEKDFFKAINDLRKRLRGMRQFMMK